MPPAVSTPNSHRAGVVGYGPFSLYVHILKEGQCPNNKVINRLMMTGARWPHGQCIRSAIAEAK
jgi:hypothetical protein